MPSPEINSSLTKVLTNISTSIDSLKDDRHAPHHLANVAQTAVEMATLNRSKTESREVRMAALLGDGTGENGKLASMSKTQLQTQRDGKESWET